MKSTAKRVLALTGVALTTSALWTGVCAAQSHFLGSVHFDSGLPRGELDDQIGREAYGVNGQIFFAPSTSPLAVGLEVSWATYGHESREVPFSSTIPDVEVDVRTMNNFAQAFFVLRGQVGSGPIQPYGDALIGLNYMYTETAITDAGDGWDEIASTTNHDDVALAYGLGGGVMVPVWMSSGENGSVQTILIDVGGRYLKGEEAEYLKEGSLRRENGSVTFDPTKSRTDMVKLQVGVAVRF